MSRPFWPNHNASQTAPAPQRQRERAALDLPEPNDRDALRTPVWSSHRPLRAARPDCHAPTRIAWASRPRPATAALLLFQADTCYPRGCSGVTPNIGRDGLCGGRARSAAPIGRILSDRPGRNDRCIQGILMNAASKSPTCKFCWGRLSGAALTQSG